MSYQLYYADGTASMGVRVMLEEIGASYELIETIVFIKSYNEPIEHP